MGVPAWLAESIVSLRASTDAPAAYLKVGGNSSPAKGPMLLFILTPILFASESYKNYVLSYPIRLGSGSSVKQSVNQVLSSKENWAGSSPLKGRLPNALCHHVQTS